MEISTMCAYNEGIRTRTHTCAQSLVSAGWTWRADSVPRLLHCPAGTWKCLLSQYTPKWIGLGTNWKFTVDATKFYHISTISIRFPEFSIIFSEISTRIPQISIRFLKFSITFPEISIRFPEFSIAFQEISIGSPHNSIGFTEFYITFRSDSLNFQSHFH